jgi:U3 small nucleolar RNA-associated protein 25
MKELDKVPVKDHGCDFSRIRTYYLEGLQKFTRQTIIHSAIQTPEINSLQKHCHNVLGSLKITTPIADEISQIKLEIPHVIFI